MALFRRVNPIRLFLDDYTRKVGNYLAGGCQPKCNVPINFGTFLRPFLYINIMYTNKFNVQRRDAPNLVYMFKTSGLIYLKYRK